MANERAARGGGALTTVAPQALMVQGQAGGGPATWFGPGEPMKPVAPAATAGRSWDYPTAINQNQRPKSYEGVDFATLRALADSYDLLRLLIETRKDQLCDLPWNITPRDKKVKVEDPKVADRIKQAENFFHSPDREHDWATWLRILLEEMFVLDAPALYRHRTMGGGLYRLKVMQGDTIKRVLDPWGDTPQAPAAAYQQILKGMAAVNYTTKDLLYRPRNPRANRAYGYSPVEQIITIVNLALRRETWQLGFFTDGNLPDALISTPPEWTPAQISQFQDWFDSKTESNLRARRTARFVPGDMNVVQTKETELFGAAEEWMARVVCFCFSVSPQPFVKMMNRATSETAAQTATKEGLAPLKGWVKSLIDYELRFTLDMPDLEFGFSEEEEIDAKTRAEIIREDVKVGLISIDEGRDLKGMDPAPEPEAKQLLIITATGVIPVAMEGAAARAKALAEALPAPVLAPGAAPGARGKPGTGGSSGKPSKTGPGRGGKGARKLIPAGAPLLADMSDDQPIPEAESSDQPQGGDDHGDA